MTLTLTGPPRHFTTDKLRIDFRALREEKGLSQRDIAKHIGITNVAVARFEKGEPAMGEWRAYRAMDWMETL